MRLAQAAGRDAIIDPAAFARQIPAAVLAEWQAFYRVECGGRPEDWQRHAELCAVVANSAPFRTGKPAKVREFLPRDLRPKPPTKKQLWREALEAARVETEMAVASRGMAVYGPDGTPVTTG